MIMIGLAMDDLSFSSNSPVLSGTFKSILSATFDLIHLKNLPFYMISCSYHFFEVARFLNLIAYKVHVRTARN